MRAETGSEPEPEAEIRVVRAEGSGGEVVADIVRIFFS